MEKQKNKLAQIRENFNPYLAIGIIFTVGIAGHFLGIYSSFIHNVMIFLTPAALAISFLIAYFPERKNRPLAILAIILYAFSMAIESIGVHTGMIFGDYHYTPVLGWHIFSVPWIIGINWIAVVAGGVSVTHILHHRFQHNLPSVFQSAIFLSILSALLVVLFDYIMEPAAIILNYWVWQDNIIPVKNYIAWGAVAFLFSIIFHWKKVSFFSKLAGFYWLVLLLYFILLRMILNLFIGGYYSIPA